MRRLFVHFEEEAFVYFRLACAWKCACSEALIAELNVNGEVRRRLHRVWLIKVLEKRFSVAKVQI